MESEGVITFETIQGLEDIDDALDMAGDIMGVSMEGLNDLVQMKERMMMELNRNEHGNPKELISKSMYVTKREDEHKRDRMVRILKSFQDVLKKFSCESSEEAEYNTTIHGTDMIARHLNTEGVTRDLITDLRKYIRMLEEKEIVFVVAGETGAGKSSVLNLMFGDDFLQSSHGSSTSTITRLSYGTRLRAEIVYRDHSPSDVHDNISVQYLKENIYMQMAKVGDENERIHRTNIKEVRIQIPSEILKCGLVIIDSPGIGENEAMDEVIKEFVETNTINGFIYVIKSNNAGGVDEDRLLSLLEVVLDKQRRLKEEGIESFDPNSVIFLCNQWDLLNPGEEEKVYNNAINRLSQCWPGLKQSHVITLKTQEAMTELKIDEDFVTELYRIFLERLRDMFINAVDSRLQHIYNWIAQVIKRGTFHLNTLVKQLASSGRESQEKAEQLKQKLAHLEANSKEILTQLHSQLGNSIQTICKDFREYLKGHYCKMFLTKWLPDEVPTFQKKGDWEAVKAILSVKLGCRLSTLIEEWEIENRKIAAVEVDVLDTTKHKLKLLHDELENIETEMKTGQGDSYRRSSRCRRDSNAIIHPILIRRTSKLQVVVENKEDVQIPMKVRKFINPVHQRKGWKRFFGRRDDKRKFKHFRDNPTKMAEKESVEFLEELLRDHENSDLLMEIFSSLMLNVTSQLDNVERKIPSLIESNRQLLDIAETSQSNSEVYIDQYTEMRKETTSVERTLRHFYQGYVSVRTIRHIQSWKDIQNCYKLTRSSFRVTDILRTSSKEKQRRDSKAPLSLFTIFQHGMDEGRKVTIKVYLPSAGIDTSYTEVARLRFADHESMAKFEGIHYSDAPPPVLIYKDHLHSASGWLADNPTLVSIATPIILQQTIDGLEYIHRHKLVHMELSRHTVSVNDQGQVKLTGCCLPRKFLFPIKNETQTLGDFIFLSRNVLAGQEYQNADDIYAFGMLMYELLLGRPVFHECRSAYLQNFASILEPVNLLEADDNLDILSRDTVALIKKCISVYSTTFIDLDDSELQNLFQNVNGLKVVFNDNNGNVNEVVNNRCIYSRQ